MRKRPRNALVPCYGAKAHMPELIYHTRAWRETRGELAMQIQARDQAKYKRKDMQRDGNNEFVSGSVSLGDRGPANAAHGTAFTTSFLFAPSLLALKHGFYCEETFHLQVGMV